MAVNYFSQNSTSYMFQLFLNTPFLLLCFDSFTVSSQIHMGIYSDSNIIKDLLNTGLDGMFIRLGRLVDKNLYCQKVTYP